VTGNGTDWVDLENTTASTGGWVQRQFDLQSYLPLTDQIQLRFVASEAIPGSLVEAMIDDFRVVVTEPVADVADGAGASGFALQGVAPNPASGAAQIRFSAPAGAQLEIAIYDVTGRRIRSLVAGRFGGGEQQRTWDRTNDAGRSVGSGVYFVRMRGAGFSEVRPITLLD